MVLPQLRNDLSMEDLSIFTKVYVVQHVQCIEENINTLRKTIHVLNELHDKFCTNNINACGSNNTRSLPDNEEVDEHLRESSCKDKNEEDNPIQNEDLQEIQNEDLQEDEDEELTHNNEQLKKKRGRPSNSKNMSAKKRNRNK